MQPIIASMDESTWGGKREFAGRPPEYEEPTEIVSFRLPRALKRKLRIKAAQDNMTLSRWMTKSVIAKFNLLADER